MKYRNTVVKCILIRDWDYKVIWAHVIPRKGIDDEGYAAQLVVKDLKWLGHGRLILKYDNEPAVKALANKVVELMRVDSQTRLVDITHENPPTYDSQANGGTEVGIRLVRGLFRTVRLCLESRLNRKLQSSHGCYYIQPCC